MSSRPRASSSQLRTQAAGKHSAVGAGVGVGVAARAYATPRAVSREKWGRVFEGDGGAFLDGGVSNRLTLALSSPVGSEADWALERLIQVSCQDVELVRLSELPGLLAALIARVRELLAARTAARRLWLDDRTLVRRATEAALVLRNLATDPANTPALVAARKLTTLVADALDDGEHETRERGPGAETTTELRLYLLEILELVAPECPLAVAPPPTANATATAPAPTGVRLLPLLAALTRSADRALVIAAFRCLVALSLNDASEAALALMTYPSTAAAPHPIQTAIELLPVADSELATAMLDFIYQHTLLPANAVAFCARPDLVHILRLATARLHVDARRETVQLALPVVGTDAEVYWKNLPPRHRRKVRPGEGKDPTTKMNQQELAELFKVADPSKRGLQWMRLAFEAYPDGEVTQVALWTAYRTEFEPHSISSPMLAAADVIKMSTEAFPAALPMVTDGPDKRFIIKGIRVRDRTDMRSIFRCRWPGCLHPIGPTSAEMLYWHLHHQHLATAPVPPQCSWPHCTYRPSVASTVAPALQTNDLSLHVRTHMPTYHPPPGYTLPSSGVATAKAAAGAPTPEPPAMVTSERYHAKVDESGELTGLSFLACLVLRNVARTIKVALGNPAGGASVNSLSGGDESIFEAFSKAAEGSVKRDEVLTRLEKVDFADAKGGARALLSLEAKLVATTMEDFGLSKILGEVIEIVVLCRKAEAAGKL